MLGDGGLAVAGETGEPKGRLGAGMIVLGVDEADAVPLPSVFAVPAFRS